MQITIRGELTIAQLRQAIYEQLHELENGFSLGHSQGATLYVNPVDGLGQPVELRRDGKRVNKIISNGPYRSIAEDFKI